MGFTFNTAYIGPYAVSLAKGQAGEQQKFRYKVPPSHENIAQGSFVMAGRMRASWSSGLTDDHVLELGSQLNGDLVHNKRPVLFVNEDLTLTALSDTMYVCTSAVGIEQKVFLERHALAAGERVTIPRYELLMLAEGARVSVNGSEPKTGPRFLYARTGELEVLALSPSILGAMSLRG